MLLQDFWKKKCAKVLEFLKYFESLECFLKELSEKYIEVSESIPEKFFKNLWEKPREEILEKNPEEIPGRNFKEVIGGTFDIFLKNSSRNSLKYSWRINPVEILGGTLEELSKRFFFLS